VEPGQQKITEKDENSDTDENSIVEFATDKQRKLMTKLKIYWDDNTTKFEASEWITEKLSKSKDEED